MTMVTDRWAGVAALVFLVAGCGDDGVSPAHGPTLCPTVQAWSDQTADVADGFRLSSREVEGAAQRRATYESAFADLQALQERLVVELDDLDEDELDAGVGPRLAEAAADVRLVIDDGAAHAAELPDEAYETLAVSEGTLFVSVEKAKAVVFQALAELADDPRSGVPRGCGRRGPLDLSPSATFPES
jgi:hypothetical protein